MLACLNTWPLAGHTVLEAVECRGGRPGWKRWVTEDRSWRATNQPYSQSHLYFLIHQNGKNPYCSLPLPDTKSHHAFQTLMG